MKIAIAVILLSLSAFFAYWLFSDSNNEPPELVFTSSFSMADIELPEFENEKIVSKEQITSLIAIPEIAVLPTHVEILTPKMIPADRDVEIETWLNLDEPQQKKNYFNELINSNLKKISLKNSHPFFENIYPQALFEMRLELDDYFIYGVDEAYAIELKKMMQSHYQTMLTDIKTICGKQWCNATGLMKENLSRDNSLCKSENLSSSNCKEIVMIEETKGYHTAKYNHHLQCNERLNIEIPEYDEKGNQVNAKKFTRKLKNNYKKCQKNTSKFDSNFDRQMLIRIKRQDLSNIKLLPLVIEEIPMMNMKSVDLEQEVVRFMTNELRTFENVNIDSLLVSCEKISCDMKFTTDSSNSSNLGTYFNFVFSNPFCDHYENAFSSSWDEAFDILEVELQCVFPENYELYL